MYILDDVVFSDHGPFVVCDYGCADGGTSMDMFSKCIGLYLCT